MDFLTQLKGTVSSFFGSAPVPGGSGQASSGQTVPTGGGVGAFFANMFSGAVRGAEQNVATSPLAAKLTGFFAQAQSQVAAQNLFGNPLVLLAVVGGLVLLAVMLIKKS